MRDRAVGLGLALAVACALGVAGSAAGGTVPVVVTGDPAPGTGGGTFTDLDLGVLNAGGQAAFYAATSLPSNFGVFRWAGTGALTAYARTGDAAPGTGGGTFTTFASPVLNGTGVAAFNANTSAVSNAGVFRASGPGSVVSCARAGELAPDMGGPTFTGFSVPAINTNGQVAFEGYTSTVGAYGIYRESPAWGLELITRTGWGAPGTGGGTFQSFQSPAINAAGLVAFQASTSIASNYGVFCTDAAGFLRAYARTNDAAPGTGGGLFAGFSAPTINDAGQAAFWASTNIGSNYGVFRADGPGSVIAYARTGNAAPGTGGGTFTYFGIPSINNAGQVAFQASTSIAENYGLFRGNTSGSVIAYVRTGDPAPDGNGSFSYFESRHITSGGAVAMLAELLGTSGGFEDGMGIYLADGQEMLQVARKGQSLAGSTITSLDMYLGPDAGGSSPVNDFGQVVFSAGLADGRWGIFVFSPDSLRWRSTGSGNWDTLASWTLSLRPGPMHDILIDPAASLTVTGPAGTEAVKSLTLGARTSGRTAQLSMTTPGGSLTSTGAVTVLATGGLTVDAGALTAASLSNSGSLAVGPEGVIAVASLVNRNSATIAGRVSATGTVENQSLMTVASGGQVTTGGGLTNLGSMSLDDGTLSGGTVTNDYGAGLAARGTVDTALVNNGALTLNGVLTVKGLTTNRGTIAIGTTRILRSDGGLQNYGTIDLAGGAVSGAGAVTNQPGGVIRGSGAVASLLTNQGGLIYADTWEGTLTLPNFSGNFTGGELRIAGNAHLDAAKSFTNQGTIVLGEPDALLSGGGITNTGTIRGAGVVFNPVANTGTVRADGGILTLAGGGITNSGPGTIEVLDGATAVVTQGLSTNAGSIVLRGGSFDNGGRPMTDSGAITGHGTFSSGGLTISVPGTMGVAVGDMDVIGTVHNDGRVNVQSGARVTFYGNVSGSGSYPGPGTVVYLATFSPGGSPAEVAFGGDVLLGGSAGLLMELGGTTPGAQYDKLDVGGTLSLGGALDVAFIYGFQPEAGQTFHLFDWGTLDSTFDSVALPALGGGLAWDTTNLYTSGALTVVPEPATLGLLALGAAAMLGRKRKH